MMKIKNSLRNIIVVILFFVPMTILSCDKSNNEEQVKDEGKPKPVVITPINQADPTILYHNGTYYLYGTDDKNADNGFLVYSSTDIENWTLKGYALRKEDAFGDRGFWAPHVWAYNGKFYMAYTANEKIAIAESTSPEGPFKQTVLAPLVSAFGQIDPFVFIDDDGRKYFYHVRLGGGNKIWVAEISDDFSTLKTETYAECITASPGTWEHVDAAAGRVAEGPTVIKHKGLYYLFYSANDFRNKDYAVGYAVSTTPKGPWVRYTGNPVISRILTGQPGSGHGDVIKGKDDVLYYVFHTHNNNTTVVPRKSAIVKLKIGKDNAGADVFLAEKDSFKFLNLSK